MPIRQGPCAYPRVSPARTLRRSLRSALCRIESQAYSGAFRSVTFLDSEPDLVNGSRMLHKNPREKKKLRSELTKLRWEIKALQRSDKLWLELIKALATPIALAGIFVTLVLGLIQQGQLAQSQEDARFDQAIKRIASKDPTERISGIVGLEPFLGPDQKARRRSTLHYLANALATEPEDTVRAELLDLIGGLHPDNLSQADLNDFLERLRDRNRSLYAQAHFAARMIPPDRRTNVIYLDNDETNIPRLSPKERATLDATTHAITTLIKNGARTSDLSGIYCTECDFTGKSLDPSLPDYKKTLDFGSLKPVDSVDLSGTDFHSAILHRANFAGANLRGANFEAADLVGTVFAGADLTNAKLTDFDRADFPIGWAAMRNQPIVYSLPVFSCANLSGADFTQSLFFGIYAALPHGNRLSAYPRMEGANLAGAKLGKVFVFASKPYVKGHPYALQHPFVFAGSESVEDFVTQLSYESGRWDYAFRLTAPDFRIDESLLADYSDSAEQVFANLNAAKNVESSALPEGVKDLLRRYRSSLPPVEEPLPCTTRN
jgi:uncharacterized protein YjbI with pentapeptide repeats